MQTGIEDRYINRQAAAAFLGLSVIQLDMWRCEGVGPPYSKLKRAVRYQISDLVRWMEERKVRPLEDA